MARDGPRVMALVFLIVVFLFGGVAGAGDAGQPSTRHPAASAGLWIVTVARGDHLWKISERRLDDSLGRSPLDTEVSPYWRRVIEVNRDGLRSGDPDLIYPGEQVTLPPPG